MTAVLFPMRKNQYWKAMGSRIRYDPEHLFDVWVEIARPATPNDAPFVVQKYPHDYADEEVLKTVPKFAFPCPGIECKNVDHFTFVMTDIEAKYRFGFCRYATAAETCMCILSCLPWYDIFYKLLNQLADILNRHTSDNLVYPLLGALYSQTLPAQPQQIQVISQCAKESFTFTCPDPSRLPTIPENRNLTEYFIAVDPGNMMLIFASMLYERRILVTSRKMSRLTACVHGSASLIYPMEWQHLYIPILPAHLLDYCSAPMPFIIGLHSSLMEKATSTLDLGDVVLLDADNNLVTTPHDDLATLPSDTITLLKKRLRGLQADKINSHHTIHGDALARSFLKALVALIGGYRDALRFREGEQITFDRDAFLLSRPPDMHPFLEKILHLQIFEEFINDRLDLLNAGIGFSDEFEMEANDWDQDATSNKYNHWLSSMKKQGKKLRREGIDKLDVLRKKANPAVRSAVRNVKDKSKRVYKDLKSRIDDFKKPTSSPDTPTRPQTIAVTDMRSNKQQPLRYTLMCVDDITINDRTASSSVDLMQDPHRLSIRLLDDPDIQFALKKSYSAEDLFRRQRNPSLAESESLSESSSLADSPHNSASSASSLSCYLHPDPAVLHHTSSAGQLSVRGPKLGPIPRPATTLLAQTQAVSTPRLAGSRPASPSAHQSFTLPRPSTTRNATATVTQPVSSTLPRHNVDHDSSLPSLDRHPIQPSNATEVASRSKPASIFPVPAPRKTLQPPLRSGDDGKGASNERTGATSRGATYDRLDSGASTGGVKTLVSLYDDLTAKNSSPTRTAGRTAHAPAVPDTSQHDAHHGAVNKLKAAYMGVDEEVDSVAERTSPPRIQRSQAFRLSTDRGITQASFMEQFDPLVAAPETKVNMSYEDEDLLKDWSLDFSFLNSSQRKSPSTVTTARSNTSLPRSVSASASRNGSTSVPLGGAVAGAERDLFSDLCDVRRVRCDMNQQKWETFD